MKVSIQNGRQGESCVVGPLLIASLAYQHVTLLNSVFELSSVLLLMYRHYQSIEGEIKKNLKKMEIEILP